MITKLSVLVHSPKSKQEQQQVAPRESKQTKQPLAEVVYRKRSRNSRKTNLPALAAKLGKSVCTCVIYTQKATPEGKIQTHA